MGILEKIFENAIKEENDMNYDRIILDLMDRVSTMERKIEVLERELAERKENDVNEEDNRYYSQSNPAGAGRDTTKYLFQGRLYGKNRLVLAVVHSYVKAHPEITARELQIVFDRSIQGSLGVVRTVRDVQYNNYADEARRFFFQPNEIVHTATEDCVVCSQWGKFNIDQFIARAGQLGYSIYFGQSAFAVGQLIGGEDFLMQYQPQLRELNENPQFMEFVHRLRTNLNGLEFVNVQSANKQIMNAFFDSNINTQYPAVQKIVEQVKRYGKQASAHISIYYAMYILENL